MPWNDVNLAEVSPTFELVPASKPGDKYTLELVGAKYRSFEGSSCTDISVQVAIAGDSESAGRQLFMDYPDPGRPKCEWSIGALKRLEIALGKECAEGQDKVEWLNSLKGFRIAAPVGIDEYQNKNGETVRRNKVALFKVAPAA